MWGRVTRRSGRAWLDVFTSAAAEARLAPGCLVCWRSRVATICLARGKRDVTSYVSTMAILFSCPGLLPVNGLSSAGAPRNVRPAWLRGASGFILLPQEGYTTLPNGPTGWVATLCKFFLPVHGNGRHTNSVICSVRR